MVSKPINSTDSSQNTDYDTTLTGRWFAKIVDFPKSSFLIIVMMTAISLGGYFHPNWAKDLKRWIFKSDVKQVDPNATPTQQSGRRASRTRNISRDSIGNSHAVIVIQTPDLFTLDGTAAYRRIVERLNELDVVAFARSIDESPPLNIFGLDDPILPKGHASEQRFRAAKERALKNPLVVGFMLSPDAQTVLIEVVYDFIFVMESDDLTTKLRDTAKAAAAEFPSVKMDISVTGVVPFYELIQRTNQVNERLYQFVGYGLILIMAFLLFRGFVVVIVVSLAPIAGVVWTLGILRYFGFENNPFSFVILPVLLSLVGFTDGVHMMVHIRAKLQAGASPLEACRITLYQVGLACFLTSATTAVGMASLAFAQSEVVREFGWSCVMGVTCTWISVMLIIPLACRTRFGNRLAKTKSRDFLDNAVSKLGPMIGFCVRHSILISCGSIATLILLTGVSLTLRPDDQKSGALPEGNEIRTALDHLDKSMGGLDVCQARINWKDSDRDEESILELLVKVDGILRQEPLIGHPLSLPRLLDALPGEGDAIAKVSMIELLPPPLKLMLYDPENRSATVLFRVQDLGSATYAPTFERIEKAFEKLSEGSTVVRLDGDPVWRWRELYRIVTDLASSLATASIIIVLILGLAFRSWRIGLISFLPNLMPLVTSASWMAWNQQPLEIVSVCCFTICLGIAVDDTIHFLSRYQLEIKRTTSVDEAIEKSFQEVGTGLVMTTLVLVAGFSSVLFSDVKDFRSFGTLGILTLVSALLCDLFMLPALLKTFDRPKTIHKP